jgi:ribonucleoside-diphosphate reductase alpha chain
MFCLLCGIGTGISVQKHHIDKLPKIKRPNYSQTVVYKVQDSIEGWADAIGVLISSYFTLQQPFPEYFNKTIKFDYSLIRPAGSPISHGGKAPGSKGLENSIEKIRKILENGIENDERRLRPIEAYDIVMHISDSVLSGGIRRSATLCLFSSDDNEMMTAKTGNWYIHNPQRGRSNNSVLLIREETTKQQFIEIMKHVKDSGEPGFIWADNKEFLVNPCAEVALYGYDDEGRSGWQMCNLSEINVLKATKKSEFLDICKAAAILGTLQAGYTNFPYLGPITESIVRRESLLGVSMTGMMDNPTIAFDEDLQREGAKLILKTNEELAKKIGIPIAARTTCIKPAGTTSCILGTSSGIHPHHARRYFRHVQANKLEPALKFFKQHNPLAVENSVWSSNQTDVVIKFVCEVPQGSIIKNQISALELLEKVKLTQQNWVKHGTRIESCVKPYLHHNVSNTINVKPEEWDNVETYIYNNRKWFCGISLLPVTGDKDYPQAPFTAIYTPAEITKEYGDASILASGLIVDGLRCFRDDLWSACSTVLGIGAIPINIYEDSERCIDKELDCFYYKTNSGNIITMSLTKFNEQKDWIRRANQFANRYFSGDKRKMTYCLKDVRNWKVWCDLVREYKDVNWDEFTEEDDHTKIIDTISCAGGKCDII